MLDFLNLNDLLIIDIETVPVVPELKLLNEEMQTGWELKEGRNCPEDIMPDQYFFSRAGIYAEFGKVICISVGFFHEEKTSGKLQLRVKSYAGKEEAKVLEGFIELLNLYYNKPDRHSIAGHNIKEFDVPYMCRRMLVNGLILPRLLDISGKKPWETKFVDTMELWKFGDRKNFTSLQLLAALFDIPTPKDDIDGSKVGTVYWHQDDLDRIVQYCQKDVLTVAQLLLRFKGLPLLEEKDVVLV
jgi:3'-5' exonuclease